jgi:hypothetical protein
MNIKYDMPNKENVRVNVVVIVPNIIELVWIAIAMII